MDCRLAAQTSSDNQYNTYARPLLGLPEAIQARQALNLGVKRLQKKFPAENPL